MQVQCALQEQGYLPNERIRWHFMHNQECGHEGDAGLKYDDGLVDIVPRGDWR